MIELERSLRQVAHDLESLGRRFAVVGGLAVSIRAEPRLTRDVDVALSVVDDADAEIVVGAFRGRGYEVIATVEQEVVGRLSTVRLVRRGDDLEIVTDLLFAWCGVEPEIVEAADHVEVLPGLVLPVASIGHLIVMKLLARDDLRALRAVATTVDWEQARDAAQLVHSRGFDRERDLVALVDELLRHGAW